jgi:DNA invertase Pin-like site-specific DNA recombinase
LEIDRLDFDRFCDGTGAMLLRLAKRLAIHASVRAVAVRGFCEDRVDDGSVFLVPVRLARGAFNEGRVAVARDPRNDNSQATAAVSDRKAGALLGYARVSTDQQNLEPQLDALKAAGCDRVYQDVGSGSLKNRPELTRLLDYARAGDTVVVWRLDRLGRGLKHLIATIEDLQSREIGFRSLSEQLDTTTPAGRLQLHIFGALGEFEREVTRERTRLGLQAARARGRVGGRPRALTPEKLIAARAMREAQHTMPQIARALGVHVATLYRHLAVDDGEHAA